jgi:hypothetical protein
MVADHLEALLRLGRQDRRSTKDQVCINASFGRILGVKVGANRVSSSWLRSLADGLPVVAIGHSTTR